MLRLGFKSWVAMSGRPDGLGVLRHYVDNDLQRMDVADFSEHAPVAGNVYKKNDTIRNIHHILHTFLTKVAGGKEEEIARLLTDKNHGYITRYLKKDKPRIEEAILDALSPADSERKLVQKLGEAFTNSTADADRRTILQFAERYL